jgi:hypothetical protein
MKKPQDARNMNAVKAREMVTCLRQMSGKQKSKKKDDRTTLSGIKARQGLMERHIKHANWK